MRLGLNLSYFGGRARIDMDLVREAERLGYDSVWAAEAWGSDAVTVLSWIAAQTRTIDVGSGILQIPARTAPMTAMTAVSLSELSGGRFRLGLGLSGPQVAEGWHGQPYGGPLGRTREYVAIIRQVIAREEPLVHDGAHYQIPYDGPGASGLGKPLKMLTHPTYPIPIYIAAIGPRNVALTAEIADGWLPVLYSPDRAPQTFGPAIEDGFAASGEADKNDRFDTAPSVTVMVTDDRESGRDSLRAELALYIGGMGARGRNFYNDLTVRYGYEEAAPRIQNLYLAGKKRDAGAAVPDALIDEVSLIGTAQQIRDRLDAWREAGVNTLIVSTADVTSLRTMAELVL